MANETIMFLSAPLSPDHTFDPHLLDITNNGNNPIDGYSKFFTEEIPKNLLERDNDKPEHVYIAWDKTTPDEMKNQFTGEFVGLVREVDHRFAALIDQPIYEMEHGTNGIHAEGDIIQFVEYLEDCQKRREKIHRFFEKTAGKLGENFIVAAAKYGMVRPLETLCKKDAFKYGQNAFFVDIRGTDGAHSGSNTFQEPPPKEILKPEKTIAFYDDVLDTGRTFATAVVTILESQGFELQESDRYDNPKIHIDINRLAELAVQADTILVAETSKNPELLDALAKKVHEILMSDSSTDRQRQWAELQQSVLGKNRMAYRRIILKEEKELAESNHVNPTEIQDALQTSRERLKKESMILETTDWIMGIDMLDTSIFGTTKQTKYGPQIGILQILEHVEKQTLDSTMKEYMTHIIDISKEMGIEHVKFRIGAGENIPLIRLAKNRGTDDLTIMTALAWTQGLLAQNDFDLSIIQKNIPKMFRDAFAAPAVTTT